MRSSAEWFLPVVAVTTWDQAGYLNNRAKHGTGSMTCPSPRRNALTQLFHSPLCMNRKGKPLWRGLETSLLCLFPCSFGQVSKGTVQLSVGSKTQRMFSMAALSPGETSVCRESKTGGKARSSEALVRVISSGPQGWITCPYSMLPSALALVLLTVAFLVPLCKYPPLDSETPGSMEGDSLDFH